MYKKIISILLATCFIFMTFSCVNANMTEDKRSVIFKNDNHDAKRNQLLLEDLNYFAKTLPAKHLNAYHQISKEAFEAEVDALRKKIDTLDNPHFFVEFNKIVAAIGDAHTGVNYWDGYLYPVVFTPLSDGIYVTNTTKEYEKALHCKLIQINGMDIQDIKQKMQQVVPHENQYWFQNTFSTYLTMPILLYGLDIVDNQKQAAFTFIDAQGKPFTLNMNSYHFEQKADLVVKTTPMLLLKHPDQNYWYEYLADEKTMYVNYTLCMEMKDKPFDLFVKALFAEVDAKEVHKMIIDMRYNSGGNSEIINPLIKEILKRDSLNQKGHLFVLTGKKTFSSGVLNVESLKDETNAILVGEPTGGSPNSYGEVQSFQLPNSQIPISYCVKFFGNEKEKANSVYPDLFASWTIEDIIKGRDSVIDQIFKEYKE